MNNNSLNINGEEVLRKQNALNTIKDCISEIKRDEINYISENYDFEDLGMDYIDTIDLAIQLENRNNNRSFFSEKETESWIRIGDVVYTYLNHFK